MRNAQWPRIAIPIMGPPGMDSTGGRSYKRAIQTPGALGGRRDKVQWYSSGSAVIPSHQIVRVEASPWRLIGITARVHVAPTLGSVAIDILAKLPGDVSYSSIFLTPPIIATNQYKATDGVIRDDRKILPVGTLVKDGEASGTGGDSLSAQVRRSSQETLALDGTTWVERSTDSDAGNWNIRNLNGNLYRIADYNNYSIIGGPGSLERSPDGGVTWSVVLAQDAPNDAGVQSVAIGLDGVLWAIWGSHTDSSNVLKIYKSIDDGVTWQLSYTDGGTGPNMLLPVDVAVDPNDSNTIAITCIKNIGGNRLVISTNGGSGWTTKTITVTGSGVNGLWITFGSAGRIVVAGGGSIIQVSDNDGDTWTTKDNPPGLVSWWILRFNGSRLVYSVSPSGTNGGSIHISDDNGDTWSELVTGKELNPLVGSESMNSGAITASGALAVGFNIKSGGIFSNDEPFRSPPLSWDNITYNFETEASNALGIQCLANGDAGSGVDAEDLTVELHYRTRAVTQ